MITRDKRRLKRLVELRTEELNKTNILLSEQKEELLQHREDLQS
jgi:hypothetical protein